MARNRGWLFLGFYLIAGLTLGWARYRYPTSSLGHFSIGLAWVVFYAFLARPKEGEDDIEEMVDANYFLGFLLTLSYLSLSLALQDSGGTTGSSSWLLHFTRDMGVGLGFSVVGLLARQVPLLTAPPKGGDPSNSQGGSSARVVSNVNQSSGAAAPFASATTDSSLIDGRFEGLIAALHKELETAIKEVGSAGSTLRGQVTEQGERLSGAVRDIAEKLRTAQSNLDTAIGEAGARLEATQRRYSDQAEQQLATWTRTVEDAQARLIAAQSALDGRVGEALEAIVTSSDSLSSHAAEMVSRIQQLPDPSRHLQGVWSRLAEAETAFTAAVTRGSTAIGELTEASKTSVPALQSIGSTTADVSRQNRELQAAIEADIQRVTGLIEELFELLETWVRRGQTRSR